MALMNKLIYPPIVDTAMDSFIRNEACPVYFNINDYNSADEIDRVQVIIYRQKTNQLALNTDFYPAKVMEVDLMASDDKTKGDYCVYIYPGDITGCVCNDNDASNPGGFPIDDYFKVQLRFVMKGCPTKEWKDQPKQIVDTQQKTEGGTITISSHSNKYEITNQYLAENKVFFSEWSTVCLIRGINIPQLRLLGDMESTGANRNSITYKQSVVDIVGELEWTDPITKQIVPDNKQYETLQSYRLKVYNVLDNASILVFDSDWQYPTEEDASKQQVLYNIPYNFVREQTYQLTIDMETSFGYKPDTMYLQKFKILPIELEEKLTDYNFLAKPNDEEGYIHLQLQGTFMGNLCIRRTSSESNFTEWVDLKYIPVIADVGKLNFEYNDLTVKSGVFYKYGVQRITKSGQRGELQELGSNTLGIYTLTPYFDHVFLTTGGRQLKIKYDRSISGLKRNVNESVTETLGSKYPYVRRNSNVDYKTFSLSGLITYQSDDMHLLVSQNDLLRQTDLQVRHVEKAPGDVNTTTMDSDVGTITVDSISPNVLQDEEITNNSTFGRYNYDLKDSSLQMVKNNIALSYKEYNQQHRISELYDYTLEREFREAVMDFLYADNVKLFKSAAEGNMLVKLTDISLEPKEGLQGLVYNFSCTVQEVAEYNLENCRKYGIQTLGFLTDTFSTTGVALGQLHRAYDNGEDLVREAIMVQNHSIAVEDAHYEYTIDHLKWIRLDFQSSPYYIRLEEQSDGSKVLQTWDDFPSAEQAKYNIDQLLYGYVFKLKLHDDNGRYIYVDPMGRFEMIDAGSADATTDVFETSIYNTFITVQKNIDDTRSSSNTSTTHTIVARGEFLSLYELELRLAQALHSNLSSEAIEMIAVQKAEAELEKLDIYEDFDITSVECCHDGDIIYMDYQCAIDKEYHETVVVGESYDYVTGEAFVDWRAAPDAFSETATKKTTHLYESLAQYLTDKYTYRHYQFKLRGDGKTREYGSQLEKYRDIGAFGPLLIEAPPGTVCLIADRYKANASRLNDSGAFRHVIGETGILELAAKNSAESDIGFQDVCFCGRHLHWAPNPLKNRYDMYQRIMQRFIQPGETDNFMSFEEFLQTLPFYGASHDYEHREFEFFEVQELFDYRVQHTIPLPDKYHNNYTRENHIDLNKMYDMTKEPNGSGQCIIISPQLKRYIIAAPVYQADGTIDCNGTELLLSRRGTPYTENDKTIGKTILKKLEYVIPNGVYEILWIKYDSISTKFSLVSDYYCFYNNQWEPFSFVDSGVEAREKVGGDVLIPTKALIQYYTALSTKQYKKD